MGKLAPASFPAFSALRRPATQALLLAIEATFLWPPLEVFTLDQAPRHVRDRDDRVSSTMPLS
jgi:hypothetical protein